MYKKIPKLDSLFWLEALEITKEPHSLEVSTIGRQRKKHQMKLKAYAGETGAKYHTQNNDGTSEKKMISMRKLPVRSKVD